jgi:hypothetical protein
MSLANQLLDIERQLWRNDAALYQFHLIEEALLVFPETAVITRSDAVEAIKRENSEGRRWAEVRMDTVHSLQVTQDVALLSYRVAARWEHEESANTALASSLYVMRDGAWKLAFHQQSPIPGT